MEYKIKRERHGYLIHVWDLIGFTENTMAFDKNYYV